jgi:hypothetical protein
MRKGACLKKGGGEAKDASPRTRRLDAHRLD